MAARTNGGSGPQYVKLIMVTGENNNKYYEMTWDGKSPDFHVKYGRVESTAQTETYPIERWNSIYSAKVKKGYKDVTEYVTTQVVDTTIEPEKLGKIKDNKVEEFMALMKQYTDGLVAKTYSVKAVNVTQKQVDDAQLIINELTTLANTKAKQTTINTKLLELYTVIPRKMASTVNFLMPAITPGDLGLHLGQEQANLDAMASQVSMLKPTDKKAKKTIKKEVKTLLDVLGITMTTSKSNKELDYLLKQITGSTKVEAIFEVNKPVEDTNFTQYVSSAKNKTTRVLIHGTKNTSVIPILEIGLKIRPAGNFQFSGKVYGNGNYFSEVVAKSMGYTGYDRDKVLLVYEVHTGNPFVYDGRYKGNSFSLNYKELTSRGYDSTYVKAGGGLLNSEIIAYNENQNRIKYIIWLKN